MPSSKLWYTRITQNKTTLLIVFPLLRVGRTFFVEMDYRIKFYNPKIVLTTTKKNEVSFFKNMYHIYE